MSFLQRYIMGGIAVLLAHRSRFVLTLSEYSKKEIVSKLKVRADRIWVLPCGVEKSSLQTSRKPGFEGRTYIVGFAGGGANKNIPCLIEAFGRIAGQFSHDLVLVGKPHDSVRKAIELQPDYIRARIISTGFVSRDKLLDILAGAALFVFPSLFEGFGIPVLEANALGVPIICSKAASLPEVAGDSAIFFDPHSAEELARSINAVLTDARLRMDLCSKGHINANRFSWESSARKLRNIYMEVG